MDIQKTALTDWHVANGASMAPFAGWNMPLRYSSVIKEHESVRTNVGMFDVSHMGEFFVSGIGSTDFLQKMTINDVTRLQDGQGQYTAMCQEDGGVVDDLIIYRMAENEYFLCVNAANIQKDFDWLKKHCPESVCLDDQSVQWSQIAVQGPKSQKILEDVLGMDLSLEYMDIQSLSRSGVQSFLARTGYTGECGYEWYLPSKIALHAWQDLFAAGVQPIGLGARDTLRLESCYLLYGQDMTEKVTALEAGLGWATRFEYDFIGAEALKSQKENGVSRRLVAFQMLERGVPRQGMDVYVAGEKVGTVTSGSVLPTLDAFGGLLMLDRSVKMNDHVTIDVRGRQIAAQILKRPMYKAKVS